MTTDMTTFLLANIPSIIAVILAIVACLVLLRMGYTKQVKSVLLYLVIQAELKFGSGTGELKYAAVTAWVYERLPAVVRFMFTKKHLDRLIEEAVLRMKEYLEKNTKANKTLSSLAPTAETTISRFL